MPSKSTRMPSPLTTASTPHMSSDLADAQRALLDLLVHVGDVEAGDLADAVEERGRALGLVGMDVNLQRGRIADNEHASRPSRSRRAIHGDGSRPSPVTAKFVQ